MPVGLKDSLRAWVLITLTKLRAEGWKENTLIKEGRVRVCCLLKGTSQSYQDCQKEKQWKKTFPLWITYDFMWLLQWISWACQLHAMPWTSTTSSKMTSPWTSCRSLIVWPLFTIACSKSTTIWSTSLSAWICVSIGCWMYMTRTYSRLSPDYTTGHVVYRTVTV